MTVRSSLRMPSLPWRLRLAAGLLVANATMHGALAVGPFAGADDEAPDRALSVWFFRVALLAAFCVLPTIAAVLIRWRPEAGVGIGVGCSGFAAFTWGCGGCMAIVFPDTSGDGPPVGLPQLVLVGGVAQLVCLVLLLGSMDCARDLEARRAALSRLSADGRPSAF